MPLTVPVDRDLARRMEDVGVAALVSYPLAFQIGPGRPLAEKLAALERYGNDVIAATA